MVLDEVPSTEGKYTILNHKGELEKELPSEISDEDIMDYYENMIFYRLFDEKAVKLQRRGDMGTYPEIKGQEGVQVGMKENIKETDWLTTTYREPILIMDKGVPPQNIYAYWMGSEKGHENFKENKVLPISVPIGSHIPHGAGLGMASNIKDKKDEVAWCVFGDGATSEGDFHEGLNFAGVFNAPTVFVCMNNQWAISVPTNKQTASSTFSKKAEAYGFEGYRVDGMDPIASYQVSKACREKALGKTSHSMKPSLVEMVTYRLGAHTTSDNPSEYRSKEEEEKWEEKDALNRVEKYLINVGKISEKDRESIREEKKEKVDEIAEKSKDLLDVSIDDTFENVYDEKTERLKEQNKEVRDNKGDK